MTCREKLNLEHPENVSRTNGGGCLGCPNNYGYAKIPSWCVGNDEICTKCWDREVGDDGLGDVKSEYPLTHFEPQFSGTFKIADLPKQKEKKIQYMGEWYSSWEEALSHRARSPIAQALTLNAAYGMTPKETFYVRQDIGSVAELYERITCKGLKKENKTMTYKLPEIKDVIFNDPAVIVFRADGSKTVVKAVNEAYDPEKGLAMAFAKKALGNEGNYYNVFTKWLPKEEK